MNDVERVALLARLSFSDGEKETLTHDLNNILKYVEQLNSLDTSNVQPLAHVIELSNVVRDDATRPCLPREDALRNAPAKTEAFFKVPKVLGDLARRSPADEGEGGR